MNLPIMTVAALIAVGLAVGGISGLVGIGGGILVIPILMFFFGFTQAKANGTSIAMLLPPIGFFAVIEYNRAGNISWTYAALLAVGYAVGAFFGARLLNTGWINPTGLRVGFAMLLIYCSGRLLFRSGGRAAAALETTLLVVSFGGLYLLMRLLGSHWSKCVSEWGAVYRAKKSVPPDLDYES